MVETQRDGDEITVITSSPRGEYRYVFEEYAFSWVLREKYVDGEEQDNIDGSNISQTVREAVKEEARSESGGILDNLDMVTSRKSLLEIKNSDISDEELEEFFEKREESDVIN